MPKGGAERTQSSINYGQGRSEALGNNLSTQLGNQLGDFRNQWQAASNQAQGDYNNIMGQYQNFANTGGFSPQDIAAMRSRAMSPVRSAFATAQQGVDRQRALQGGYSPGYGTMMGRLQRQQSQAMSDASIGTEAALAGMKQQGRLAGMSGMAGMYGATPGLANMYGNQLLNNQGQYANAMTNQANMPLEWAKMQAQQGMMPGKWQQGFQNVFNAANNIAGLVYPWAMNAGGGPIAGASGSGMQGGAPSYAGSMWQSGNWGQPGAPGGTPNPGTQRLMMQ